jgi:hypothetical protein
MLPAVTHAWSATSGKRLARPGALLWGGCFFAFLHASAFLLLGTWGPEGRDPEFGLRLRDLRARLAERSLRGPQVLVLGSSRASVGFRPEVLAVIARPGLHPAVIFNFGQFASGPIRELVVLERLLRAGIHPGSVIIELWPPMFEMESDLIHSMHGDPKSSLGLLLSWQDRCVVERYLPTPGDAPSPKHASKVAARAAYRDALLRRFLSFLELTEPDHSESWQGLTAWGWLDWPKARRLTDEEEWAQRHSGVERFFQPKLIRLTLPESGLQALHDLLDRCRRENIRAVLLLMPEAARFRSWYAQDLLARWDGTLVQLSRQYKVPVIDARGWADDDDFADEFHLTPEGAARFTQRLGRAIVEPLLEGKQIEETPLWPLPARPLAAGSRGDVVEGK